MKFVHFTDVDTLGHSRTVSVAANAVEMLYQGFDNHQKTAIVVFGDTQWVNLPLVKVEAALGITH